MQGLAEILQSLMNQRQPVNLAPQQMPGTGGWGALNQTAASLPTMAPQQPGTMQGVGGALQGASGGDGQRFMSGLSAANAPPAMQFGHAGLQRIMQQLGIM